jgi:hypothetical protein
MSYRLGVLNTWYWGILNLGSRVSTYPRKEILKKGKNN